MKPFEHWLSLDLSSMRGTLAIHRVTEGTKSILLCSQTLTEKGDHSEQFIPHLEQSLKSLSLSVHDLDRYITSSGPGSFTGLRIALASLKALAYVKTAPIEILSGSESRGLAWLKKNTDSQIKELFVITSITADKFVAGKFIRDASNQFQFVEDSNHTDWTFISHPQKTAVILDEKTSETALSNPHLANLQLELMEKFPAHAAHLGASLAQAKTRKTYQTISEWVNATPNYFGSTRF
jgi:tRNA threonylcarbamoyl adenosine modification protein YeaZ